MKKLLHDIEIEIKRRGIDEDEISGIISSVPDIRNRRIIGGYASVSIVDREGHKITIDALKEAVDRFMQEEFYRPINVFHSDVTIGRILPKWTNPETGNVHKTFVDDKGWYVICELRDDIEIADKVWKEIQRGNIRSFSIAGSSKTKEDVVSDGGSRFTAITSLDLYECTLCEEPVNPLSKFDFIYNPNRVQI